MIQMIKYTVECTSLYGVIALSVLCILLGFVAYLLRDIIVKIIPYIIKKITSYNDIHTKAENNDTSIEVELHRRNNDELL